MKTLSLTLPANNKFLDFFSIFSPDPDPRTDEEVAGDDDDGLDDDLNDDYEIESDDDEAVEIEEFNDDDDEDEDDDPLAELRGSELDRPY